MTNLENQFKNEKHQLLRSFTTSLPVDKRLYQEDIAGSLAHVTMLVYTDTITPDEGEILVEGLESILADIANDTLQVAGDYKDIHSFVEAQLVERIGKTAKKMQMGRSRHDQVALAIRLFAKNNAGAVYNALDRLIDSLNKKAAAEVVAFGDHLGAYVQMFTRDQKRIGNAIELMDENPLGCGALAESIDEIDRDVTTSLLGFAKPVDNFRDGVSDRDYLIELMADFSLIMMHVSRLSDELILWSSEAFQFIQIDAAFTTESKEMLHQKNPEVAELIRGKAGRVYGSLFSMLTTFKSLPLAYSSDLQEDKEQFFDALDTVMACLEMMSEMIDTLHVNGDKMKQT